MRARLEHLPARLGAPLAIAAGALVLRLLAGVGFANYDTLYALAWGGQLSRGQAPAYEVAIAPTPHPLVEALGAALSPFGPGATEDVTVALGFLALSACGWVLYRLASLWFGRAAGAVAALVLLTRVPLLSYGVRAYVDIPYLLLALAALLLESRRRIHEDPPAATPVLVLLALAGLLRPEAWAFSGFYWLYLLDLHWARLARPLRGVGILQSLRRARAPARAREDAHTRVGEDAHTRVGEDAHTRARGRSSKRPFPRSSKRSSPRRSGWRGPHGRARIAGLTLLAAAAPLVWVASDWLITGHPLWSLTNTRHTAHTLGRVTGVGNIPQYIPRRIGEILRPPVLLGAAVGGGLSLLWLPRRALITAAAGAIAVLAFATFAAAGLPIDTRYAFLASAILCVFCGAGAFGWTRLARDDPRRRWWMVAGVLVLVALALYTPAQYSSARRELDNLARQQGIQNDLLALVHNRAITLRCGPVGVPNHAPVPLLALYLKTSPANVLSAQSEQVSSGIYVDPASREVEEDYVLDPLDPHLAVTVPPGFTEAHANRSWLIFQRC